LDPRRFGSYANREFGIAKAIECFGLQFGVHYPFEERPAARPARETPLYDRLRAARAVFGSAYGWERPNWFASGDMPGESVDSFRRTNWFDPVARECQMVSTAVGLADLSAFTKFEITGSDAESLLETLGANRPPLHIGRVGLVHALTPSGGIASEFTVTRLGADRFYLVCAAAAERHDEDLLRDRAAGRRLGIDAITEDRGVIGLMGPCARAVLGSLTNSDLSNDTFPWLAAREVTVAGVRHRAPQASLRPQRAEDDGLTWVHRRSCTTLLAT